MKNYIPLFMLICFASFSQAQNDFENQWKKVTKLEDQGLTKSASDLVETIYATATKAGNQTHRIKALLHISKYMQTLEEDAQLKIVNRFKSEIDTTKDLVTKHLLENMLATMYWQYFQQSRYQFYNRTKTSEKVSDDFRAWDLETIFNEIHKYYQCSLTDDVLLQQEPLEKYSLLLHEAQNSKDYRPTLFDLLSHNALSFYKTDENSITQPSYKFTIDNEELIGDAEVFIATNLDSEDTFSLQLNALKIYKNLLKFHKSEKATLAFVEVDIKRLNFVAQHATFSNKDELLLKTLKSKSDELSTSELSALYNYEIASLLKKQGDLYTSNTDRESNTESRWKLKEAAKICSSTIAKFPNSIGAKKCEALIQQINLPFLRIQAEEFIGINSPSKVLVNYKNLEQLDFKIYKVTAQQLKKYNETYRVDDKAAFFKNLNPIETFSRSLKTKGDFQTHSTEIVIPNLANGLYLIKAETNSNVFVATHLQVTDMAIVESVEDATYYYQLINRHNGSPIVGAEAELTYSLNRTNKKQTKTFISDRFGKFELKKDKNYYRQVEIKINSKEDTAYFGDYYLNPKYEKSENNDTKHKNFLFTDRSIYRPGQTVYFKGIATQSRDGKTEVFSKRAAKIRLKNVNGEVVSELLLETNEFGSVQGEFILPNDGLTGSYHIDMFSGTYAHAYFSVEEYKRPKFKPEFQPISEAFKVNDSVTVKGTAMAFAGSPITDANVVYRVKRNIRFPGWFYWRRPYYVHEAQEITFGETKTNAQGEFEVTFKAIPDETVSKDNLPIFNYEITADITDINGETRSTSTIVNVGYHSMTLHIDAPQQIDKNQKELDFNIISKNLNGETVPSTGTLKIYKLKSPDHVLRTRPWQAPDYQMLSKEEFKKLFPHEPYQNENQMTNWEKGDMVFNTDFNTEESKTLTLKRLQKWDSGQYIIIAESKDRFGQTVKDEIFTALSSDNDKEVADQKLFEAQLDKSSYEVDSMAKLTLGSAAENITVTVEIEKDSKIIMTQLVQLNNSKKTITIPVLKSDLGGFVVHTTFAAFNEFVSRSFRVNVPYPKTDLDIETKTFRDKLLPGQDETWSFKIKGPNGDKVTAELLASMYDASLDEFVPHNWSFNPIQTPEYFSQIHKNSRQSFGTTEFRLFNQFYTVGSVPDQGRDALNWFGFYFGNNRYLIRGYASMKSMAAPEADILVVEDSAELEESVVVGNGFENKEASNSINELPNIKTELDNIQIRKNLNETAFFFPQLQTDKEGNVSFNFKAPEALTKWKLQLLAHTKSLESAITQIETVTQKELMVMPNAPRFLREGDKITISSKIANLSDKQLTGVAHLILTDAVTGKDINSELSNSNNASSFVVDAKGNTQVSWSLDIPEGIQAVQYKVVAKAGDFSDGEQNALPVLSNRMMVTETLPMWIRSNQTKTFTLDKLKNQTSTTLSHHKLTLEMTSNPAWYAVQALPYLMEYPYDCNEQTFSRYFANALAQHIVKSNPKIEAVFNQWKSTDALLSNLEKNQELKSLLIQETPWLRDAQSETEQKKRIALLFDLNKMNNELQLALRKLKNNQYSSGAWPWFNGGPDNRFITQQIVAGFGHLKKLNVIQNGSEESLIKNALQYLDAQFIKEYKDIRKYNKDVDLSKDHLSHMQLHYLYTRSFYPEHKTSAEVQKIMAYYQDQIKKYWLSQSLYAKGLMTLTMNRIGDSKTAGQILKSLNENSITSEELGMYWKDNTSSWYWYQAPIETQALMIEAFSEVGNSIQSETKNLESIDNLKIWLLKNKQTNNWKTTKATTEAVYALLLQGSDWLSVTDQVDVTVGTEKISPSTLENVKVEAGTGYYKTSWTGPEIKPEQADVTITKKGKGIAWGALYWQYFEDLDKITSAETPLKLSKKLFLKTNTEKGEEISEITSETQLKVGDLIRVRIELRSDRNMEFVHLKDMRASGLEPVNVLSQYKWQDGLGYYESTKDAATNFFMDYLPKGVFVFEYDLRVNNAGDMSNGISTIQSMYAPEFSSHSEGVRIFVK